MNPKMAGHAYPDLYRLTAMTAPITNDRTTEAGLPVAMAVAPWTSAMTQGTMSECLNNCPISPWVYATSLNGTSPDNSVINIEYGKNDHSILVRGICDENGCKPRVANENANWTSTRIEPTTALHRVASRMGILPRPKLILLPFQHVIRKIRTTQMTMPEIAPSVDLIWNARENS